MLRRIIFRPDLPSSLLRMANPDYDKSNAYVFDLRPAMLGRAAIHGQNPAACFFNRLLDPEKTAWRGPQGAEAHLSVRRAAPATRCIIAGIGVRSGEFMNNPG